MSSRKVLSKTVVSEPEYERRFLVLSMDPDIQRGKPKYIYQGYLDSGNGPRVRITDNLLAESLVKTGKGVARVVRRYRGEIPLELAYFLLNNIRHKLSKNRYERDGWKVDCFEEELSGLTTAEFKVPTPNHPVTLPPWIHQAIEVTDELANRTLAKLAYDISIHGSDRPVREYFIDPRVKKLVFTGGPGSGKSTAIAELMQKYGDKIQCMKEIVTILIGQLGLMPPTSNPIAMLDYQRTVYRVQLRIEHAMQSQASADGKRVVLVDRGTVDSAVYMKRGVEDLIHITGGSLHDEFSRYAAVFCLATPPKKVYDEIVGNNPARRENYDEAETLGKRIREVWNGHPRFIYVPNGGSWEEKYAKIDSLVGQFIEQAETKKE